MLPECIDRTASLTIQAAAPPGTQYLIRRRRSKRRRHDRSSIDAFLDKPESRCLVGAAYVGDQVGLDVAMVVLEAQDRAAADGGGGARLLQRPLQRRPRHAGLRGREDGTFQDEPL